MTSSPPTPSQRPPSAFNKRIIAAMAAIVSLIIVGLLQFDQVAASIYAYFYGRLRGLPPDLQRLEGNCVPTGRRPRHGRDLHGGAASSVLGLHAGDAGSVRGLADDCHRDPVALACGALLSAGEAGRGHPLRKIRGAFPGVREQDANVLPEDPSAPRPKAGIAVDDGISLRG